MNIDLLIQGGTILDGSGAPPQVADVAICDGRIAAVGNLPTAAAAEILDAAQCVVTPGFIDIHSHSDFTLVVDPRAVSSISQGVTLEVVGNCGHGCAPLGDPELTRSNIYGCQSNHEIPWRSVSEYLDTLQRQTPAVNVVSKPGSGKEETKAMAGSLEVHCTMAVSPARLLSV